MGICRANCFKTHNKLTLYPLGKCPFAPSDQKRTYRETTNVKVKGSHLLSCRTTSRTALDVVQKRTMTIGPTSNPERVDSLVTSIVVEDAGEGGRHDDEELIGKYQ